MPATLEQSRRLVDTYAATQATILAQLIRVLIALWGRIPSWDDPDMLDAWAARSAVETDVALGALRRYSRAYLLTYMRLEGVAPDSLPGIVESYERGGIDPVEVYKRPWRERKWVKQTQIDAGATPEEATRLADEAFKDRLTTIATDDVMLTARDETWKVMRAARKVTGYRRVLHPEFSKTGPCGLCVVAADRVYTVDELMPLHDNCKCTISPVTETQDLGAQLNREDLDAIYNAAGGNDAEALKQLRVKVVKHGELGPMLLRSGGKWVNPSTVNRRAKRSAAKATPYEPQTAKSTQTNWSAMKATSERALGFLEAARARNTNTVDMGYGPRDIRDLDVAIQYHRDLIARAERHAA